MSEEDVHPDEMSATHEFDDEAIEALLSGSGSEINGDLAAVVGSLRAHYTSQPLVPNEELSAMIGNGWAAAPPLPAKPGSVVPATSSRRMGFPVALRRFAVATAALFALTGALGVANALPGPLQNAVAKVGIGHEKSSGNHGQEVSEVAKDKSLQGCEHGRAVSATASGKTNDKPCPTTTPTTTATGETATVPNGGNGVGAKDDNPGSGDNTGKGVSGVAKDPSLDGCEHGRAVSGAASGKANDKPCPQTTTTTTTVAPDDGETTTDPVTEPTTVPGNSGGVRQDGTKPKQTGTNNGNGNPTGSTNGKAKNSSNDD